jgi:ABC-type uncharacterized transport system ATPase subunit
VEAADLRAAREALRSQPGVLTVEPAGAKLHLFLSRDETSPEKLQAALPQQVTAFRQIVPSLEDVFIGLVRKSEARNG